MATGLLATLLALQAMPVEQRVAATQAANEAYQTGGVAGVDAWLAAPSAPAAIAAPEPPAAAPVAVPAAAPVAVPAPVPVATVAAPAPAPVAWQEVTVSQTDTAAQTAAQTIPVSVAPLSPVDQGNDGVLVTTTGGALEAVASAGEGLMQTAQAVTGSRLGPLVLLLLAGAVIALLLSGGGGRRRR